MINNFDKWEDHKYLTVTETAEAVGTDEMVIIKFLLEGYLDHFQRK